MGRSVERPKFEVGDILRDVADAFVATRNVTPDQAKALRDISRCRTPALGGHADVCPKCGRCDVSYNSCRNRHCPRCQWSKQEEWIGARTERLLNTHYFHVVFTVPRELRGLALSNPRSIYDLLFRAASRTLLELGQDDKWLGATLGLTVVLHTWTRKLQLHPHVHCLVTGGGLSPDETAWRSVREGFLFPIPVMKALFRGKFLAGLRGLYHAGTLRLTGKLEALQDPPRFKELVDELYDKDWVVYAKRPMGGPRQVINYLGRYTHRVAISNSRLLDVNEQRVLFRTRGDGRCSLTPLEFTRRFLLHVLPTGFMKIRHYGLFASASVNTKLVVARGLLPAMERVAKHQTQDPPTARCPRCGGLLVTIALDPAPQPRGPP